MLMKDSKTILLTVVFIFIHRPVQLRKEMSILINCFKVNISQPKVWTIRCKGCKEYKFIRLQFVMQVEVSLWSRGFKCSFLDQGVKILFGTEDNESSTQGLVYHQSSPF